MPQTRKLATCCYCGTRSVLVLDRGRHELSCAACGEPLHNMKFMPTRDGMRDGRFTKPVKLHKAKARKQEELPRYFRSSTKRRKKKPLSHKLFDEIWDVVEDIFD